MRKSGRRALAMGLAVLLSLLTTPAVRADEVVVSLDYSCQATVLGVTQTIISPQDWDDIGPHSVPANSSFTNADAPQPQSAPSMAGSSSVTQIKNLTQRFDIVNGTIVGTPTLSGGSANIGTTSVSVAGTTLTVTASGPIAGGASYQLPTMTLTIQAGASGTVQVVPDGTSFSNPGLTFTMVVRSGGFNISAPTSCFPDPSQPLYTVPIT